MPRIPMKNPRMTRLIRTEDTQRLCQTAATLLPKQNENTLQDLIKFPPMSQMQMKTSTMTVHLHRLLIFGPTLDNEPTENEEELPGHLKRGQLCQEGIGEAQKLGCKTAEEARVIGVKYSKSICAILIEAGLSIKHSRSESDWNAHQCWFMDNHPCEDKERQSPFMLYKWY
ncbi:hypothetical protein BDR07DRAFT_1386617 [Suillus spraguei]|nr:hypothetical protein BDR07DRAFT_1386617 [Suillus spraguei]